MSHYNRRYAPLQQTPKGQSFDRSLPFKNNEARLKHIYEGQQVFKQKNKDVIFKKPNKRFAPLPNKKPDEQLIEIRHTSNIHKLNLGQIRVSNRYKQIEKDQSSSLYQSNDNDKMKARNFREQLPLTSRNKEELTSVQRGELFKIKRKSISGNLKKKIREQAAHHLSSVNPTIPLELNYFEQGRKNYKQGKVTQALKLFQLSIEKNQEQPDSYYYASLCCLSRQNYQRSYDFMSVVLDRFTNYAKKTVYLFAAIAAKHLQKINQAITLLSNGISKFPDFIDLYFYRAKLLEGQNDYQKAQQDYEIVLKSKKDNAEVLLLSALCLKKMGKVSNCLSKLNEALYNDKTAQFKTKILLERLKIHFEANKIKQCKKDILKLQEAPTQNSELYYYKGLIQLGQNNKKQALLSFEKCIRINNCKEAVSKSLVEITKSKIEDRDFYSALYHIQRANFLQISSEQIQKFRLFAEAVVFMMKRKINEGVRNLDKLENEHRPLGEYFDKLFYLYRGFGHFMQSKHELAIKDYMSAERFVPKDKYTRYNQLIAEGIVNINHQNFQKALEKFDEAQTTISSGCMSQKIEPYIYRAMTFVQKIKSLNNRQESKADELEVLEEIFIALKELDKAYDISDSNSNMLYLRSLIYMYLGKSDDGLQDIIKAISKSEQNVAKYFFYRALAHETLNNKKQALNDFNICINLDDKYAHAYLERAKLLFSSEQSEKGLEDLRKLKQYQPDADCKLHECCLYYLSRQYDLAQNCIPQIENIQKKRRIEVLLDLKQLRVTDSKSKMQSKSDKMICDIILGQWSTNEQSAEDLEYFNRIEYYNYLGIKCYHQGNYEEALSNFSLALKEKSLLDLQQNISNEVEEEEENQQAQFPLQSETKEQQLHYLNYNIFICYLANGERKKAYQIFIRDLLPAKEYFLKSEEVGALSKLLFQTMRMKQKQQSPNEKAKQKQVFELTLFRSLFGESVDFIQIQLPNAIFRTKLCYLMPFAREISQQYLPKINNNFILSCLQICQVQNRPEPPWVKRSNQDLIFTDEIIDINVEFQTTEHDEQNQEDYEGEGDEEGEEEEEDQSARSQVQRQEAPFDPRRFRDQMRLDDDIERKLQLIMQKKKKTE